MAKSIKDQIEEEKKRAAAATLSPEAAADLADLEALAMARADREEAEAIARGLDLLKRLAAMQEIHGVDKVKPVAIKGSTHTFIIKENAKAHTKWEAKFTKSMVDKKVSKFDNDLDYAVASVADWSNGRGANITDFVDTVNGHSLIQHFKDNPGMVSPVTTAALGLNHFIAEEAKS